MKALFKTGQKRPRAILLCPGPVLLSKSVQRAVTDTNIGHREEEFSTLLSDSASMLQPILGASDDYQIAFITGSGTAANETVLSSMVSRGRTLVVSNGEFGERLYSVAQRYSSNVDILDFGWQQKVDIQSVATQLAKHDYALVSMVHHETSSGILNPISAVADLAHANGAIISVDAISSIGAEELRVSEWEIDVITGASGKALSAMPGVGILCIKTSVLNDSLDAPQAGHYLDLQKHFLYMREHRQTPNTPAVHVFVSLHASLLEMSQLGLARYRKDIADRALQVRSLAATMGLECADYDGDNSNVITCIALPTSVTFQRLAARLKSRGIIVYNGKGVLMGKLFQIGHIGALRRSDTPYAMKQIQKLLVEIAHETATPKTKEPHTEALNATI